MKHEHMKCFKWILSLVIAITVMLLADTANAGPPSGCIAIGTTTCTDNPCFDFDNNFLGNLGSVTNRAKGIMEEAINRVAVAISLTSRDLFNTIIGATPFSFSFTFLDVLTAAILLYIIFYGVGLIFGFVQATLLDALIRLFKLGIIYTLIQPGSLFSALIGGFFNYTGSMAGGWGFFSNYVVYFFNEGTNQIIMLMVNIASGNPLNRFLNPCTAYGYLTAVGIPYNVGCPFQVLDQSVKIIFSPRMFITLLGAISTPPYGIIVAAALIMSIFTFFMVLIRAMQVYALSLVAKAILFGIAPIFISFILFEKTRSLFFSWLGQIISYSLQPILLFTFLAFFGLMLQSAASDLLPEDDVHLCYTKSAKQANTPVDIHAWKFGCKQSANGPVTPYTGEWTWDGAADKDQCPDAFNNKFPIDPVKILIFLLLCYLMFKISDVIVAVAIDLAGGVGAALSSGGGGLQSMLGSGGGAKGLFKGK